MAEGAFQILVAPILGYETTGELEPSTFSFNDPVWGGGQFSCKVTIPRGKAQIDSLKYRTTPDEMALYVVHKGAILFGGPLNYRSRVPGSLSLSIKAQSWKAWTYDRLYSTQNIKKNYNQSSMATDILRGMQSEVGVPRVSLPAPLLPAKNRDFTIEPGWSIGKTLDSFGSRDGGFEWDIKSRYGSSGMIEHYSTLYAPGAMRSNQAMLMLDRTRSANRINIGEIVEDATERRSRIWGAGEGTYPDINLVKDEDPYLKEGKTLLRESYMSWSGVTESKTLFDHARAERVMRNIPIQTVNVEHPVEKPNILNYMSGDRARLRLRDSWEDVDYRGVRIIDRAISKERDKIAIATVTLDLTDVRMDL